MNKIPLECNCKIYMGLNYKENNNCTLYTIAEFRSVDWGKRFWNKIKDEINKNMWDDCIFIFENTENNEILKISC